MKLSTLIVVSAFFGLALGTSVATAQEAHSRHHRVTRVQSSIAPVEPGVTIDVPQPTAYTAKGFTVYAKSPATAVAPKRSEWVCGPWTAMQAGPTVGKKHPAVATADRVQACGWR